MFAPLDELQTAVRFTVDKQNITKVNVGQDKDKDATGFIAQSSKYLGRPWQFFVFSLYWV